MYGEVDHERPLIGIKVVVSTESWGKVRRQPHLGRHHQARRSQVDPLASDLIYQLDSLLCTAAIRYRIVVAGTRGAWKVRRKASSNARLEQSLLLLLPQCMKYVDWFSCIGMGTDLGR